jgi:hypothetical protein
MGALQCEDKAMTAAEYETVMGPDGRVWWREDGGWHCRSDGTVIESLDELLPSGETKAEAYHKKFFAEKP